MNGTVKRIVTDKGFGFILADDGKEYFFHSSSVMDGRYNALTEGQKVSFDPTSSSKGPRAEDVQILRG